MEREGAGLMGMWEKAGSDVDGLAIMVDPAQQQNTNFISTRS
jgi:hypothetical protein